MPCAVSPGGQCAVPCATSPPPPEPLTLPGSEQALNKCSTSQGGFRLSGSGPSSDVCDPASCPDREDVQRRTCRLQGRGPARRGCWAHKSRPSALPTDRGMHSLSGSWLGNCAHLPPSIRVSVSINPSPITVHPPRLPSLTVQPSVHSFTQQVPVCCRPWGLAGEEDQITLL